MTFQPVFNKHRCRDLFSLLKGSVLQRAWSSTKDLITIHRTAHYHFLRWGSETHSPLPSAGHLSSPVHRIDGEKGLFMYMCLVVEVKVVAVASTSHTWRSLFVGFHRTRMGQMLDRSITYSLSHPLCSLIYATGCLFLIIHQEKMESAINRCSRHITVILPADQFTSYRLSEYFKPQFEWMNECRKTWRGKERRIYYANRCFSRDVLTALSIGNNFFKILLKNSFSVLAVFLWGSLWMRNDGLSN